MITLVDSALESQPWLVESGPSINPIPADAFSAVQMPSGALKVSNISSKAFGGALAVTKRAFWPGLPYLGLDLRCRVSSDDLPFLGRLEIDGKFCRTAGLVGDGSGQWNASTGTWQIDNASQQWVDVGAVPPIVPDVWFPISLRYRFDPTTFSVLSVAFDGTKLIVPPAMQNLPLLTEAWQPTANVQLQLETLIPGSCTVIFDGIKITWSDTPF